MKKLKKYIKDNINKFVIIAGIGAIGSSIFMSDSFQAKDISYYEFNKLIQSKMIEEIKINKDKETLIIKDKDNNTFKIIDPKYNEFREECLMQGVKFTEEISIDYGIVTMIIIGSSMVLSMGKKLNFTIPSKKVDKDKMSNDKLDDIIGLTEVKKYLQLIIKFLKNPTEFTKYGAKLPSGIIFYGPAGTGKTKLARAVANEANVPFFYVSGSDLVELYSGMGAKKVRSIFEEARKNTPCILFIDEIDAIGKARTGSPSDSEREQTLNELLTQLDGFQKNEGIFTISATNHLELLDKALIRPGRFSEKIMIPVPQNKKERLEILKLYSKDKIVSDEVLEYMTRVSTGFSGAELENFMNECAITQILEGADCIDLEIAENTFFKIVTDGSRIPSTEKLEEEKTIVAWHEAGHALATKLYGVDFIQVTISGSSSGIGGFSLQSDNDKQFPKLSDMKNNIKICYAGRIAESFLLDNDITIGASNDIEQASELIKNMIQCYGMNKDQTMLNLNIFKDNKYSVDEARIISNELYNEVYEDLKSNIDILEEIANTLIEKETLQNEDLEEILHQYNCAVC